MLSDALQTLATQFGMFRADAHREKFDVKNATAFNKLVTSLTTLQESERRNTAQLALSELSQSELERLAEQAQGILGHPEPSDGTPDRD
jgi:hypothetical protein